MFLYRKESLLGAATSSGVRGGGVTRAHTGFGQPIDSLLSPGLYVTPPFSILTEVCEFCREKGKPQAAYRLGIEPAAIGGERPLQKGQIPRWGEVAIDSN